MAIDLLIEWEGVGAPSYARRFRSAASIRTFGPALRRIAVEGIAPAIKRNFEAGGRPPWAPLSEETVRTKVRMGYQSPTRILVATGAMMKSATSPSRYVVTKDSIVAEPSQYYWVFHQHGTSRMPQRIIMNLQLADQRRIGGIFDKFIADHMAKSGLTVKGQNTVVGGGSARV